MKYRGAPKVYRSGTHRIRTPQSTLGRLSGLLPVMGITRIANVTGLDCIGIPVVMVCRPNSRALAVSQGKGLDLDSAKASGLMESIESYHAERVHLPIKFASYNELKFTHKLIDVQKLPRPKHSRFHDDLSLPWIEGEDLIGGGRCWLPFEAVHTDFRLPPQSGSGAFFHSSNGLASGNDWLEAVSHGICELVERDSTSLWYAKNSEARARTRLDVRSIDDPDCIDLLDRYRRAGVAVAVWETTSDVGLPSFDCLIIERNLDRIRPLAAAFGAGCHVVREVAFLRALTEAAQSRLTSISGSRDDRDRGMYERAHQWDTLCELHAFITNEEGPLRSFRDVPTFPSNSLEEDVTLQLNSLRAAGIGQVIVVDLSRREFEIPVVKVVIPGLEVPHRMAGYTPGTRSAAMLAKAGRE
jgi:YcaO-like protein with predicted kinase domain